MYELEPNARLRNETSRIVGLPLLSLGKPQKTLATKYTRQAVRSRLLKTGLSCPEALSDHPRDRNTQVELSEVLLQVVGELHTRLTSVGRRGIPSVDTR